MEGVNFGNSGFLSEIYDNQEQSDSVCASETQTYHMRFQVLTAASMKIYI
jgi:hypothetical protein